MPIGIQRINAKKSQPNERIIFIKPLKGPDEAIARDFLERIAAQCLPIMKEHHLSVMSLEEYEPNAEFVGRNFNAGEVIQLVLKARFTGHWLPFDYVQMVMMHELAHCKQMNHSRAFWAVRNQYADQMRGLWARQYTGEGLWGRGALLSTGEWEKNSVQDGELLPEHLCGGTYRSRGRKRKAKKPVLSYKEQKERRILKKFGANGVALGEDVNVKRQLEKGRTVSAKPRVAGSARGRELRAAAALARFDKSKKEAEQVKKEEEKVVKIEGDDDDETASGSETDSGDEYDDESVSGGQSDALDINGKKLLDAKGRGMVKICEDENPEDQDAQNELLELRNFGSQYKPPPQKPGVIKIEDDEQEEISAGSLLSRLHNTTTKKSGVSHDVLTGGRSPTAHGHDNTDNKPDQKPAKRPTSQPNGSTTTSGLATQERDNKSGQKPQTRPSEVSTQTGPSRSLDKSKPQETQTQGQTDRGICPVCSFANTDQILTTCTMCGNVLDLDKVPGSWACKSSACVRSGSKYMNSGDAGVCGACGGRRHF
ncbi:WLM domain containing protein [Naviculisporaceae sp. PSN 640]